MLDITINIGKIANRKNSDKAKEIFSELANRFIEENRLFEQHKYH